MLKNEGVGIYIRENISIVYVLKERERDAQLVICAVRKLAALSLRNNTAVKRKSRLFWLSFFDSTSLCQSGISILNFSWDPFTLFSLYNNDNKCITYSSLLNAHTHTHTRASGNCCLRAPL